MNTINKALVYFSIGFGFTFSLIGLFSFFTVESEDFFRYFLAYLIFGIAPLVTGLVFRKKIKKQSSQPSLLIERKILKLAQQTKGKFTLSEASLALGESLERTKAILEEYANKNLLEIEINENGIPIFIYKEIYYLNN